MMYDLLLAGVDEPERIARALAEAFGVSLDAVDMAAEADDDSRNWDAAVSCEYERRPGPFSLSLDIYVTEAVTAAPEEDALAVRLARDLAAVILFPAVEKLPSVWKVSTPRGEVAYARVIEPVSDTDALEVTGVEIPVPELASVPVSRFPEVIKELQLDTPIVDSYLPDGADDLREVRGLLVNWERLTVRMARGWPPSSWYPADMYLDDLRLRDKVVQLASRIPAERQDPVTRALDDIDAVYRRMTVDDDGQSLAEVCSLPADELRTRPWYWLRRPADAPWATE
ncbi:hypothetical protein [Streptomyces specialis]|uniref:hypothetical protein n=1 Tax=Streptomyces specialis TaxID=498367 RepID=UPI00073E27C1|nr:hypothetical protein [Streptomyces specialis]